MKSDGWGEGNCWLFSDAGAGSGQKTKPVQAFIESICIASVQALRSGVHSVDLFIEKRNIFIGEEFKK